MKNKQQWCEFFLINNINLMIHYDHIKILPKEVCDDVLDVVCKFFFYKRIWCMSTSVELNGLCVSN
jgi:hypothetical protein